MRIMLWWLIVMLVVSISCQPRQSPQKPVTITSSGLDVIMDTSVAGVSPGATGVTFARIRLTANAVSDITITSISVTDEFKGNIDNAISGLQNLGLKSEAGLYLTGVNYSLDSRSVTFQLDQKLTVAAGQTSIITLTGDVAPSATIGSQHTLRLGAVAGMACDSNGKAVAPSVNNSHIRSFPIS